MDMGHLVQSEAFRDEKSIEGHRTEREVLWKDMKASRRLLYSQPYSTVPWTSIYALSDLLGFCTFLTLNCFRSSIKPDYKKKTTQVQNSVFKNKVIQTFLVLCEKVIRSSAKILN